jgi:dolichyl-phosphooligosaccharide-protein glycotransferase
LVVSFWTPIFIAPLAGIVAYLFLRRFTNNYGAATAGILTVIVPFYFMRTIPGWFDTDMFNLIFPFLIVWCFFEALKSDRKSWILLTLSSAFFMFLFAVAWNGWPYLFYVLMIFCILTIIFGKISGKIEDYKLKKIGYISLLFFITSVGLIGLFRGVSNILNLIILPFQSVLWGGSVVYSWPNVYLQVRELQEPSFGDLLGGLGPALLLFAILGIISFMVLIARKNNKINKIKFMCIFSIFWAVCGFLSLLAGIRFIILLAPPLILITGIFVGFIVDNLSLKENRFRRLVPLMIFFIILPSLIVVSDNYHNLNPRMNDDIWATGIWVHDHTNNNTVIISSWVYGHFFTAVSDRPVVIDGSSQNSARAYWINRAFYTDNESLSRGIFSMLATSGDRAYSTLNKYNNNTSEDVEILNSILGVDNKTAESILENKYNLTPKQTSNVLEYTHPNNAAPFVVITMNEMIYEGYWIFNFGGWDFNTNKGLKPLYSYGNLEIYNNTLKSDDGVVGDLKSNVILWNNSTPHCVIKVQNGVVEKYYKNESSKFCIVLQMDDNLTVVLDRDFENSMFARMIVEKNETSLFRPIYRKNGVVIWELS